MLEGFGSINGVPVFKTMIRRSAGFVTKAAFEGQADSGYFRLTIAISYGATIKLWAKKLWRF